MENTPNTDPGEKKDKDFKWFAAKRIVLGAIGIVLLLWLVSVALNFFETPEEEQAAHTPHLTETHAPHADATAEEAGETPTGHEAAAARRRDYRTYRLRRTVLRESAVSMRELVRPGILPTMTGRSIW